MGHRQWDASMGYMLEKGAHDEFQSIVMYCIIFVQGKEDQAKDHVEHRRRGGGWRSVHEHLEVRSWGHRSQPRRAHQAPHKAPYGRRAPDSNHLNQPRGAGGRRGSLDDNGILLRGADCFRGSGQDASDGGHGGCRCCCSGARSFRTASGLLLRCPSCRGTADLDACQATWGKATHATVS